MEYVFTESKTCNMCGCPESKFLGQRMNRSQGLRPRRKTGITVSIVKCKKCGLIYSNPQPTPLDIQSHYGIPPEEYWQESYFIDDPMYGLSEINTAKGLMDFEKGMKALDIGAGIGKCMNALTLAGFEAYGIEPSEQFRTKAISRMGIMPERLVNSTLEDADYPNNEFDFITFGAVLEHLCDPSESIIKTIQWLKPSGVLHIEIPSSDYLINKMFNWYYKLTGSNFVANISPMHEPYHLFEFTLKSFKKHAAQNDYKVAEHQYHACTVPLLPNFTHRPLQWYMDKTNTGMELSLWLKHL